MRKYVLILKGNTLAVTVYLSKVNAHSSFCGEPFRSAIRTNILDMLA